MKLVPCDLKPNTSVLISQRLHTVIRAHILPDKLQINAPISNLHESVNMEIQSGVPG